MRIVEAEAFRRIEPATEGQRVNRVAEFVAPLGDGYRPGARVIIWEGKGVRQESHVV